MISKSASLPYIIITGDQMNDLQAVQLDILKEFTRVAEKENLVFFAMFGTLLGASRHGGFIPWDDDIDIAMPRSDYDKLRLSNSWFSGQYFLQTPANDPAAAPRFLRLQRIDTTYITDYPSFMTRGGKMGIYIDIFPLDDVPGAYGARAMHQTAQRVHEQMYATAAIDEHEIDELPDFKAEICYGMGGIAGHYPMLAERYEWVCSRYKNQQYYTIPVLSGARGTRLFDKSWFKTGKTMDFEGIKIPVPSQWSEVLVASYSEGLLEPEWIPGKSPDEDKEAIIDVHNPYTEYTSRYTNMLKGIKDKQVMLFGAGDSLRIWLERFSKGQDVICVFDNSEAKLGTVVYGLPIKSPDEIPDIYNKNTRLIITSVFHKEIGKKLDNMNIKDYYVFIDGWDYRKESE